MKNTPEARKRRYIAVWDRYDKITRAGSRHTLTASERDEAAALFREMSRLVGTW
jgi:hypothetical protein